MADIHPAAPHHLPAFIPGADGSDPLFTIVVVFVIGLLMTVGILYFKLHSLPEHLAEKHNSTQLMLISVLAILALFTHNNMYWVLALLIAVIRIPDYLSPLWKIATSLEQLAAHVEAAKEAESAAKKSQAAAEKDPRPATAKTSRPGQPNDFAEREEK